MTRTISSHYSDPLDLVWLETARSMGLAVSRTSEAYASTDGQGGLFLSRSETMDPDDCVAQMVLHEICHWMVQGTSSVGWVDWGLDNEGTHDAEREHACLRLQAALLVPWGLRQTLAPTTDFRVFYDALPSDPFHERDSSERESIVRARAAYARRDQHPFRGHLEQALQATARIGQAIRDGLPANRPSNHLLSLTTDPLPLHRTGLPLYPDSTSKCADCAWYITAETNTKVGRCRQSDGKTTAADDTSCTHFEPLFDCLNCGACCREAYDTVEVADDDPARHLHLSLLVERTGGYDMKRSGARCVCLRGGTPLHPPRPAIFGGKSAPDAGESTPPLHMPSHVPFTCTIYETRPQTCRDFAIYSDHCLHARRRVGLSR